MSAPSPNDLFMNVWVSKINSEEFAQPGDAEWDQKLMHKYWAKVWIDCLELSQHLQRMEDTLTQLQQYAKPQEAAQSQELEFLEE